MKTLHRWTCPTHGRLHQHTQDSNDATDVAASAIAARAHDALYAASRSPTETAVAA